jgi:hypothetical protein
MNDAADRNLRDHFAALRREDAAGAPAFATVRSAALHRPPRGVRLVPLAGAIAVAVVAIVAAVGLLRSRAPREPLVSLSTTRWQSPTDFLLRVPGAQYLETVPRLTL